MAPYALAADESCRKVKIGSMDITAHESLTWKYILNQLISGQDLGSRHVDWAMDEIMTGSTPEPILASFLTSLHMKGETSEELGALARGMLAKAETIDLDVHAVDIVGTGGDQQNTVNISTMAALVIAGTGATVVKHGNRASTSKSGSADVLEALGIQLDMPIKSVAACARQVGITFLFAMTFHPSMRFVGPTRKMLGIPTAFNYLGPMTNPARVSSSAIGVANPQMVEKMAWVFANRGDHALIFRGDDGLDELTIATTSQVWEASGGTLQKYVFNPEGYGIERSSLDNLRGGDAEYNASVFRAVLAGEGESAKDSLHAIRNAVLINAAAGLIAYRKNDGRSFEERYTEALADARQSIDTGAAAQVLNAWVEFSHLVVETPSP